MTPNSRLVLVEWQSAPKARESNQREEHLPPLMVAAGAADEPGHQIFVDEVVGILAAGYKFGDSKLPQAGYRLAVIGSSIFPA